MRVNKQWQFSLLGELFLYRYDLVWLVLVSVSWVGIIAMRMSKNNTVHLQGVTDLAGVFVDCLITLLRKQVSLGVCVVRWLRAVTCINYKLRLCFRSHMSRLFLSLCMWGGKGRALTVKKTENMREFKNCNGNAIWILIILYIKINFMWIKKVYISYWVIVFISSSVSTFIIPFKKSVSIGFNINFK